LSWDCCCFILMTASLNLLFVSSACETLMIALFNLLSCFLAYWASIRYFYLQALMTNSTYP
jgi:hypothetical protein